MIDRVERPTEYRQKEYPDQEVVRGSEYPGFVVERQKENRYSRGNTEVLQERTLDFCLQHLTIYLLLGEVFSAAPGGDRGVPDGVLVVLVTEHRVVRHQGEHDHVLGHDDQHQDQHRQQHPSGRGPPGPDLVEDEAAAPDPDVPDPGHGAEEEEQDHESVEDVVHGEYLLGTDKEQVHRVGKCGVLNS